MQEKTYRTEVRTDSDFDDIPEVAVFAIGEDSAREIAKLAKLVKEHGLHKVDKFDYRTNFYRYDPEQNPGGAEEAGEENDVRTECDCLNVSETEFWFTAYLKHTDVEVLTGRQPIADLLAHFGFGPDAKHGSDDEVPVGTTGTNFNEIAQVVVFASGGITQSVAVRGLPQGDVPCIVVDYDDRHEDAGDISPEDFERKKLGINREEFDKSATYIW